MAVPRLFAAGLWLGVTAAATAMVWTATSIVAADVTDRPAPVVAHRDVVNELATAPTAPTATTTTTSPSTRPSTVPAAARATTSVPSTVRPATTTTTTPTTPTSVATSPTTRPPPSTTTPLSGPSTASYSTAGGVVGVSCSGLIITLVSAIPANGYAADVVARGPANVEVHFVGSGKDLSVKAVCFGQPIRYYDNFLPRAPGTP